MRDGEGVEQFLRYAALLRAANPANTHDALGTHTLTDVATGAA